MPRRSKYAPRGGVHVEDVPGLLSSMWNNMDMMDRATLMSAPVPVAGDVMGLMNDLRHYYNNPDERTWGNYALTGAGLLPFVPAVAGISRKADDVMDMTSGLTEADVARRMENFYGPDARALNQNAQDLAKMETTPKIQGRYPDADQMQQLGWPGGDQPLMLPNPQQRKLENELIRQGKWQDLEKAAKQAGIKRSGTGRYVGAGPDVTSPQKKTAIVNKYMQRTQDALDAGIPPGYFYQQGRDTLADLTQNPEAHRRFAELLGPTSTQVGPKQNLDYAIRAMDQANMGTPVNVGLYPNSLRRGVQDAIFDEDPWKGYKVERYRNLLGPADPHAHPMSMMPPNDQWEGFGTGLKKGQVPSGPTQVAFSDEIREQAMNRLNKARVAEGLKPLNREEMQELHWAAIRAQHEGRPLQLNPGDTIQGSVPGQTFQHSWEAAPGPSSGIMVDDIDAYTDEVYGLLADPQGKDRLVSAMGGELQQPMVRGPGVYKGETSPGVQSRSLVSHTQAYGLDPASAKRVDATEAVRQYALGQEGRAGHVLQPAKSAKMSNVFDLKTSAPITEDQARAIDTLVNQGADDAAVVFTGDGYRVLNVGDTPNDVFTKRIDALKPQLDEITGPSQGTAAHFESIYDEYDWAGGKATEGLLQAVDDPMFPGAAKLADSEQTRALMGEFGDMYDKLKAAGVTTNDKLTNVLKTWKSEGLEGVKRLVDQGLAPVAVLGVLGGSAALGMQEESQPSYY